MRQMFTCGAALTVILALGSAAHAQYPYRGNPYANNLYQYQLAAARQQALYQMAVAQQRAQYQAAIQRQQMAYLAQQQRAQALRQQQQWNALPPHAKRQVAAVAQAQWQQQVALELQRQRAMRDGHVGPVEALAAIPLAIATPFVAFAGLLEALGG